MIFESILEKREFPHKEQMHKNKIQIIWFSNPFSNWYKIWLLIDLLAQHKATVSVSNITHVFINHSLAISHTLVFFTSLPNKMPSSKFSSASIFIVLQCHSKLVKILPQFQTAWIQMRCWVTWVSSRSKLFAYGTLVVLGLRANISHWYLTLCMLGNFFKYLFLSKV